MQDFINKFINEYKIEPNRFSCLIIALTDARRITGRNINTGEHELNILEAQNTFFNPYSFIGAINYLLILDMIGEIFGTTSKTINKRKITNTYKALKYFSSVSDQDIDTIIALRNSLAHNYGLINIPSAKEINTKQHKFTLDNSDTTNLILYPVSGVWNGDFNDKSQDTSTKISYERLIDLIEAVYLEMKAEQVKGNLFLSLLGGIDELKARFTIRN